MNKAKDTIYLIDIDGVLADYVGGFLNLYNQLMFTNINPHEMALSPLRRNLTCNDDDYEWIKHVYRKSKYKLGLEEIRGFRTFRQRHSHAKVWIWTSRPINKYPRNEKMTIQWLNMHNINYEQIIFIDRFHERKNKIEFIREQVDPYDAKEKIIIIDDDISVINELNGYVYKTFLFNQPYNRDYELTSKSAKRISNLAEL